MGYAIIAIIGALMRRVWGGYLSPHNLFKRVLVPILAAGCAFYQYEEVIPSLVIAGIITFAFLMPKHGYGIAMGRDPSHPLWACLLVMSAQYGGVTLIGYLAMMAFGHLYLPLGLLVPLAYYGFWKLWEYKPFKLGGFIDGATAPSELVLGAVLFGSIL